MKFNKISLFAMLLVFSSNSFSLATDEWVYQSVTGDLKESAGCKGKDYSMKKVKPGSYRFKNDSRFLCNNIGFGWSFVEVENEGTMTCDACEGEYEGEEKYRCRMTNVKLKCRQVKRGW